MWHSYLSTVTVASYIVMILVITAYAKEDAIASHKNFNFIILAQTVKLYKACMITH